MEVTLPPPPQATAAPPSPGMGSAELKDCMEELLKFTLTCSIHGELDVGLSKGYCSRLLQDDPSNPFPSPLEVHRYASFLEMLQLESLQRVLPGVTTFEEGVQVYRNFYSEEKESINGVLAICVTKSSYLLHKFMASILLDLGHVGIQRMLNMVHTVGTISEALPPPTSMLVSSFLAPHNAHVKGSALTDGARALAKHVNRSSDNYWGELCGSDSHKNKDALDVISQLIVHCCWMNMHVVPPHGTVFEIRVAEGFGARWSEDGSKFIGFLEPYMVDGHSKGWKH